MVNYQRVDQTTERIERVQVQFDHQSQLPICWRPTSETDHQSNQAWIEFGTEALLNWHCKIPDSYPLTNRSSYPSTETCSTKIRKFPLPHCHVYIQPWFPSAEVTDEDGARRLLGKGRKLNKTSRNVGWFNGTSPEIAGWCWFNVILLGFHWIFKGYMEV